MDTASALPSRDRGLFGFGYVLISEYNQHLCGLFLDSGNGDE